MAVFRVQLRGENFWIAVDGQPTRVGFYTARFVEAADSQQAELEALQLLRTAGSLQNLLNDERDRPMVYADDIAEVAPTSVPEVQPGLAFFPDDGT